MPRFDAEYPDTSSNDSVEVQDRVLESSFVDCSMDYVDLPVVSCTTTMEGEKADTNMVSYSLEKYHRQKTLVSVYEKLAHFS